MENDAAKRQTHKDWRREAKKLRRKRIRQKAARIREEEEERLRVRLEQSSDYLEWLEKQNKLEEEKEKSEKEEHDKLEKTWLATEVKAQKEWKILQVRKAKAREVQLAQEEKIRKEFEEMQDNARKRKEAERRRRDEQKKMFDRMKKEIDAYIDDGSRTPKALRSINETQPGKEICPFFSKTGACRYGDICSRNHQRPSLSSVILVPNFYTHFSLERHSREYDTDVRLEYDHRETRNHFRDFYFDVVPELEKFGKIKTLQYCKNTEPHLRGNLYVEYQSERDAARALRGLKGRWYAGRQLHCEFVNLKSWRGAICGMVRCPKGSSCNFLHVFRNPTEDYGVKSPPLWQKRQEQFERTGSRRENYNKGSRSNWGDEEDRRNWRWSESPERDGRQNSRPMQYRNQNQNRNFQHRNFNNRGHFDNRRNDGRNFYNNDRRRNFDNRNRGRPFNNFHDRNKRRYSDSDNNDEYGHKLRRKERRSRSRSQSRSRSRSYSRSPSRSLSRSVSRSVSRSISKSPSRSRSRSPIRPAINVDDFDVKKMKSREARRSVSQEKRRRPPSPPPKEKSYSKAPKKPTGPSKWDAEKREGSSQGSARSRSASPYIRPNQDDNNVRSHKTEQSHYSKSRPAQQYTKAPSSRPSKSSNSKDYEWDTTDSEKE